MNEFKTVNILGDGIHVQRFMDALMFYSGVAEIACNDNRYDRFDAMVIAEPYYLSCERITKIIDSGFSGILIVEKMPFKTNDELNEFLRAKKKFTVCFSLLRLYEPKMDFSEAACYTIKWPNLHHQGMKIMAHTIPNVLLFLKIQFKVLDLAACVIKKEMDGTHLIIHENQIVSVLIYDTDDDSAGVIVNNQVIKWPNYIHLIWRLFDEILEMKYNGDAIDSLVMEMTRILETNQKGDEL